MPALLAGLCGLACNFEVPSSSYLAGTTLISVTVEVVELGPLNADRVGIETGAPIAELMPFDRAAFEAIVVDRSGERLPASELETLWFQCGPFDCGAGGIGLTASFYDRNCDDLDEPATADDVCRLGAGDGRFEFQVPQLGQLMTERRVASYYGVVAWGRRTAEGCWAARRAADEALDDCAFIQRSVRFGPTWWMLAYAELVVGLTSPIPIPEIPGAIYLQAANRVPLVRFDVTINGEYRGPWPEMTRFEIEPGDQIEISSEYDELSQLFQTYFVLPRDGDIFLAAAEILRETAFTSNSIVRLEGPPATDELWLTDHRFAVDEHAEPGVSRILLVYFDDRFAEGVAALEFEVGAR